MYHVRVKNEKYINAISFNTDVIMKTFCSPMYSNFIMIHLPTLRSINLQCYYTARSHNKESFGQGCNITIGYISVKEELI